MASKNWWWGLSTSINLQDCDPKLIKDPKVMKQFVKDLIEKLDMKRVGPTKIKRFGHGKLCGYSLMQFIETSTIVAHFDEKSNRAFIDIFSCKKYSPIIVANFCKKYFKARKIIKNTMERK